MGGTARSWGKKKLKFTFQDMGGTARSWDRGFVVFSPGFCWLSFFLRVSPRRRTCLKWSHRELASISRSVSPFPLHVTVLLLWNYAHFAELCTGDGLGGFLLCDEVGNVPLSQDSTMPHSLEDDPGSILTIVQ